MRSFVTIANLLLLIWLATACGSEPAPTPYPTYTLYPTYTPYPTDTPPASTNNLSPAELEQLVWPTGPRDDVVPFEDAVDFIGEKIIVEGTVVRTHNSGNVVFLNFSPDFDGFSALIFPDDWPKFPSAPEDLFYGKLVRVEGVVEEYEGNPEIIIREPWQIEVALTLGEPIITDCNCPQPLQAEKQEAVAVKVTPVSTPADTETPQSPASSEEEAASFAEPTEEPASDNQPTIVSWQDAAAYAGQVISVEGQVVDSYNSGKVVLLNFDQDFRNTFKVAIFPDAWPLFPEPPEDYYRNRTIRVTGEIKMYQNAPEIIVDQPDQIEIVE